VKLCSMFSGGKDSTYALHWAILKGFQVICMITMIPEREDSWMFQFPNVRFTVWQAKVMGLPILQFSTSGIKDRELIDLKAALSECKSLGGEGIVTGALLSDYQRMNINVVAEEVGIRTFSPLWRKDQANYMRELTKFGFRFVITSASAYGFPMDLVGKEISGEEIEEVIRAADKYGFNCAFEGGEAETFVVQAPLFKGRLRVKGEIRVLGEFNRRFDITEVEMMSL